MSLKAVAAFVKNVPAGHETDTVPAQRVAGAPLSGESCALNVPTAHGEQTAGAEPVAAAAKKVPGGHDDGVATSAKPDTW